MVVESRERLRGGTEEREKNHSYEFQLSNNEFQFFRSLIYSIAGISLAPSKKDLVYSRLARRLRARQMSSFEDYIELLKTNDPKELEEFTNALTTNLTSFFRESYHFPILADHLTKIAADRSAAGQAPKIRIWCCAASTGEEPYSIAMTVLETFATIHQHGSRYGSRHGNSGSITENSPPPVTILATDIDTKVLSKARAGLYSLDQVMRLKQEQRKNFFYKGRGRNDGLARVRPELQQLITFERLNLLADSWDIQGRFDAIFCRNVLIYFDKPTQARLLGRLHKHLNPDGLLFAGHSENLLQSDQPFTMRGKTVYSPKSGG